jgi:hypothetical protein
MQMGKRKSERTNKRRQAQRETEEQGNTTKHKACWPESCDVITTPAAAWALDRNVQTHWVNERAVRLYCTTGVTRAAFTFRSNLKRTMSDRSTQQRVFYVIISIPHSEVKSCQPAIFIYKITSFFHIAVSLYDAV